MSKKKDKKKSLILVLLLFAVIGLAGYGVYSYFWTDGDFSGQSDTVEVASFDPRIGYSDGNFVGDGGSLTLICDDSESGSGTVTCTGAVDVYNNGGTDITVEVDENEVSTDTNEIHVDNGEVTVGTPTFSWSNTTITPNSSETLTVTVPVDVDSDFASGTPIERNEPYNDDTGNGYDDEFSVTVSFRIIATQAH